MFAFRKLFCLIPFFLSMAALPGRADTILDLASLGSVATETGGASAPRSADQAIDKSPLSYSETPDVTNSFWQVELERPVRISRIVLYSPPGGAINNLVLRVQNLRDQTVFKATVSGAISTWSTNLPTAIDGRIVRIALENGQTNGVGDHRVMLTELIMYGDPASTYGPDALNAVGTVWQSSTNSGLGASLAVDGNPGTASETQDTPDSYWLLSFDTNRPIQQVELVNSAANDARLQGLTLRILDNSSNSVASTTVTDPGAENNWIYTPPPGTTGRYLKIGLENGAVNGQGNHIVSLAEVNVLTATNLAAGKPAYMTRDSDTLPPNTYANDGSYATAGGTYGLNTHDYFWETDLGRPYALDSVRVVAADGMQANLTHATVTVLDKDYNAVFSQHLGGTSEVFDVSCPEVFGQYVRVSSEYAERTTGTNGSATWLFGMKEVQAFGQLTNEVGLLNFTATQTQIVSSASSTLQWQESGLYELDLYPGIGSVGSNTMINGTGSLDVSPVASTEYTLVGLDYSNTFTRALTVEVDGQKLPARINEFMADNQLTLRDGDNNFSDWIELHNPNNMALDLSGYYLSDNPSSPTKWRFPDGVTISPHGYLLVFASNAGTNETYDSSGYLHTTFALDNAGESILLTASNGVTLVDAITNFPAQTADLAYGRTLNGQWTFMEPTPGAPNTAKTYDGWLDTLDFDHKRGWYTNSFSLVISNPNPDSQVFWSTNGTDPTNLYTGPLTISGTTGVRASVQRDGYKSPRIKTETYLFLNDILNQSVLSATITQNPVYTNRLRQGFLDLPIVAINVPPPDPKWSYLVYNNERPERDASVEIFMPDGNSIQQDCGLIHYGGQFGTGSGLYAKKTWQLNFRGEYGASKLKFPLFEGFGHGFTPHDSFDELDIHAGNQDQGGYGGGRGFYLSHRFGEDTMLDMGDLNPHGRFIQLFLNGVYMGQFDIHERLTDAFLAEYLGGSKEDYLTVKGNDNTGSFGWIPGVAGGPDRSAWDFVRSNRFSYATIEDAVDVTNLIDFMLMWEWGNAESEFRGAGARVPSGGSHGFQFWLADADGLLRQQSGASGQINKDYVTTSVFTNGPGYIFGGLLTEGNPDFKTLLADRIYKNCFNGGALTPSANLARLNLLMAEITNSMVDECARWTANSSYTPTKWQSDAQYARDNILPVRTGILVNQCRAAGWYPSFDPPQLSQYGGSVSNGYTLTVTAPAGTVYYTLDGSDPRLPGGAISPDAIAWTPGAQVIIPVVNLPLNATWRYFNTNAAPAGSWTTVNYDDSTWPTGTTPMGYPQGDDGVNFGVVLDYGSDANNKWVSYYFRKSFVVTNLAGITTMMLGLNRDDGAVVYLNGTELMRDNMPSGPVSFDTLAATDFSGSAETNVFMYSVPANLLTTGTNVVAVEVHQGRTNSTDIHFNLSLSGSVTNYNGSVLSLTLTNATTFDARVLNGTNWSALASADFVLAPLRPPSVGDLVISELNYHPPDSDDYEFVEIDNISSNQVDMTGTRLSDGIDYSFPNGFSIAPGGFAVAVKNPTAFAARYQTPSSPYYYPDIQAVGPYSGKLSDSGERIALLASNGVVLSEVTYQDGGAWPSRADGNGSSLELRDPLSAVANPTNMTAYMDRGENWRSSSLYFGSPGRFDTDPHNIVISEILAHTDLTTDWIEFQNRGANPVDLGGLYLSDTYNNFFRYYIPANTIVPGNGFLTLNSTNFGFAFSEHGEDALLIQASGTNVIRFVDTVDFPATDDEESIGRYLRSDGVTDFTELRSNTMTAPNALPRIGPVVMSEIMYKPSGTKPEYVELVNIASTNALFYDPAYPTNTWLLSDAVDFTFPTNQSLAPGAAAIICDTNAATFRAQYGISPGIPVYGPWSGALNNAGENIVLARPGNPETNGFVPYYRVDHVRYEPAAPWPEHAYDGGISLERVTLEGYGNDPGNWAASITNGTPGTFVGNRPPILDVTGDTTVTEGDIVSLTAQESDPDDPWQTVSLSAQNLPGGSSFDPVTGAFTWTTGEADGPGVYNLRFIATDSGVIPMSDTQMVTLTVLESNQPPTLDPVADMQFPAQQPFTLDLSASDADLPAQTLTFAASGLPPGLGINPATGEISGSATTPGTYPVDLSVTDDGTPPLTATNGFTLTVTTPFTLSAAFSGGATQFSFQSLAGENYDVQYSYSLSPPDWQLLRHITNAPGGLMNITNAPATNQCFIRVIWNRD